MWSPQEFDGITWLFEIIVFVVGGRFDVLFIFPKIAMSLILLNCFKGGYLKIQKDRHCMRVCALSEHCKREFRILMGEKVVDLVKNIIMKKAGS